MPKIIPTISAVLVDDVLKEIKEAVDLANEGTKLPISTVEIVLKLNATVSGGIDFSIPLISSVTGKFVGKINHITETRIVFEPKSSRAVTKAPLPGLSQSVRFIKDAIGKSEMVIPNLQFKSAKTQVDFTVTETGSISCIFSGSEEVAGTHSLIISFGIPAKAGG
ncbi:MAG: hypothetical protein WCX63_07860 [Methanoregula sp.]